MLVFVMAVDILNNKNLLITGGAGFIGANFIIYFLKKYPKYNIINLDNLTYAANIENLREVTTNAALNKRYCFIQGNITNKDLVSSIFIKYNISDVIHFAAESHVDNSIDNPAIFFDTNVMGTFNLIDIARNYWMLGCNQYKSDYKHSRFHHISTDEVYGSLGYEGYFNETTPYAPNSPYSASKAGSDFIVRSYFHTYGMNVTISNCSNNYGPRQHAEKFIPVIINKAINKQLIPIYGTGLNIRDWLFVDDHCSAIDAIFHRGQAGETYVIGGNCEKTNLEVVRTVCNLLNKIRPVDYDYYNLVTFVTDRSGHDLRYAIDARKINSKLEWTAQTAFQEGLTKTIQWYL